MSTTLANATTDPTVSPLDAAAPSADPALQHVNEQHGLSHARQKFAKTLRGDRPGMKFEPTFCPDDGQTPFATTRWTRRSAAIKDDMGGVLFEQTDCEVPESWSQLATNVVVSKYFYGDPRNEGEREKSVRQLVHRVTRTIADWGLGDGYFDTPADGEAFYRDLTWLCLHQHGAFNSPVWFNVGLNPQYGVTGSTCNWGWDRQAETTFQPDPYEFPQGSACFIQHVEDNMEDIMRLACSEAMLFKFGSGTGTDLSTIRSQREKLSGGGTPSGPLSFMRVYDSIAGVVKSGGKTRRAAKMQSLKVWHADILEFIECKWKEEKKAHALIREGYESNFNGEAYSSVFFQNANLSVRLTDDFMDAVRAGRQWQTRFVTDKVDPAEAPSYDAKELLNRMAECAWNCGDPGVQYDTTINKWHTCPASGDINASNPCSEYMFLDDTACNLSSINLMKFNRADGTFDVERFRAAARTFLIAQEILVDHASYPTEPIARNSHRYRPLGLGYSNLGSLLMTRGIPYDSDEGRGVCGSITALLHGEANRTSAEIAGVVGTFDGFDDNREPMMNVMRMHREAVDQIDDAGPAVLKQAAAKLWDDVLEIGERHGFRNAQATVLAPTGTISFMMDCDTTGIEPDIALVKYKQLAGGGMLKIVNNGVRQGLTHLGYEAAQIQAVLDYIDAHDTIEGAPGLNPDHLPVFDCAFQAANGTRSIDWRAHVTMMAAAQPFLSGAISKTVNMPREVTPEDIADAYFWSWELGLKAVAIYRDGSKQSQPLNTSKDEKNGAASEVKVVEKVVEKIVYRPRRERLHDTRQSLTHKFSIGGHEGYLCVGMYPDGRPGEIFITMAKEGSTIGGIMDSFGTALSIALQYGVPLEVLVNKFSHTRFEPQGHTTNKDIRIAKSVVDYIARWLGLTFMSGDTSSQAQPLPVGNGSDPAGLSATPGAIASSVMDDLRNDAGAAVAIVERATMMATFQAERAAGHDNGSSKENGHSGGNGNGSGSGKGQSQQFSRFETDAPSCDNCGSITVRNGNCHLCHNCGNSMGCS